LDPIAVEHAKRRLRKAERAIDALKAATDFDSAEEAWTDFLLAASAVYSKLEQGSKANGKSAGWYGRKKKERRDDPLLRYLHHARNSDEHGIERIVERYNDTGPIWGHRPKFGERIPVTIQAIDPNTHELIGEAVPGFYPGSTIKLIRAVDTRFNDFCDPPQSHLGSRIRYCREPVDIGELGLGYLRALVAEAEELV
jgi:hypothetical protein